MNKLYITLLISIASSYTISAQKINKNPYGISAVVDGVNIVLKYYSPSTIRISKYPTGRGSDKQSLAVIAQPKKINFTIKESKDIVKLKSADLEVQLNLLTGSLTYFNSSGKKLFLEKSPANFIPYNDNGENTYSIKQSFVLDKNEEIYGLGILQNGKMSQRGTTIHMVQNNTEDFVPFFQSIKGYGVYWDNYSPTNFSDTDEETSFQSEVGDAVDYYFMVGNNADKVIEKMRNLTGQVPMLPLWTYGFSQSKERYKSQNEIVDVLKKYRELKVPLDGIIQDWQYWGNNYLWNAMDFLNPEFPDPKKMVDDIHENNAHLLISIWSSFGPHTKPYKELEDNGMLFDFKTWPLSGSEIWPPNPDYPSGVKVYDAYHPKARDIYWKYLKNLYQYNIDAWWMDSTEPDHLDFKLEDLIQKLT